MKTILMIFFIGGGTPSSVEAGLYDDIFEYFKESESDNLEEAIKELGGEYTEEEIRLVRIKFISEMGN